MSVINKLWNSIASTASLIKFAVPSVPITLPSAGIFTGASLMGPKNILMKMHKTGPIKKVRPPRKPLDGNPFLKGVILKTLIKKPKKPNSANRKCVLVRLSNGKEMVAYVPGIGHNLQVSFKTCFWNLILNLFFRSIKLFSAAWDDSKTYLASRSSALEENTIFLMLNCRKVNSSSFWIKFF